MSFSLYAATVKEAPVSVTLDHFESLGDRMGSYNIESISPNVSGSILLKDCVSRGGAAPGLALREPPRYRCHLGCILLKMAAMSLLTGPAHYQPMKKQGSIILGIVSRHDIAGIWVAFSPSGSHSSQDGSDMVADRAATTATLRKGRSTRG